MDNVLSKMSFRNISHTVLESDSSDETSVRKFLPDLREYRKTHYEAQMYTQSHLILTKVH